MDELDAFLSPEEEAFIAAAEREEQELSAAGKSAATQAVPREEGLEEQHLTQDVGTAVTGWQGEHAALIAEECALTEKASSDEEAEEEHDVVGDKWNDEGESEKMAEEEQRDVLENTRNEEGGSNRNADERSNVVLDLTEEPTSEVQPWGAAMVHSSSNGESEVKAEVSTTRNGREESDGAGASASSVPSNFVERVLTGLGFQARTAKGDGNCLLLSVMAGVEITPQEASEPDAFASERVASLRRGAVDLLASEAALDGIPKATFWAGEEFDPASSDNVRSEMEAWRALGFWQPDTPKRVGTFILSVALFLRRPVFVLERGKDGEYLRLARVYGARDNSGQLKHTAARPHMPETIPTWEVVPTRDLLVELQQKVSAKLGLPAVIEYNGTDHFNPWVAAARDARVTERVVVVPNRSDRISCWRRATGMVAWVSESGKVLVAADGGLWTWAEAHELYHEVHLSNESFAMPVVCGLTWHRAVAAKGMLLGYPNESVFGGQALAYHAHIVRDPLSSVVHGFGGSETPDSVRTRSCGGSKDTTEHLRTYIAGDWVLYAEPGPDGERIMAVVMRVVAKERTPTAQSRKMLILFGQGASGKIFVAAPFRWYRVIQNGASCTNIDAVEAPVMKVSSDELVSLNNAFVQLHAKELPATLASATKMAYCHPPMLEELKRRKKVEVDAMKAQAAKGNAASKRTASEVKVAKGKRASSSADATSARARAEQAAPAAAEPAASKKKGQPATEARITPTRAVLAKPATRAGAGEVVADVSKVKAERAKAEAEAQKAKAEADIAKAEAEKAKAEAEKLLADAERARAEAEKVKADAERAKAEARMAEAEADKAKASEAAARCSSLPS